MRCMPRSDNVGAMCRRGGSHDARMSSTGEVDVAFAPPASTDTAVACASAEPETCLLSDEDCRRIIGFGTLGLGELSVLPLRGGVCGYVITNWGAVRRAVRRAGGAYVLGCGLRTTVRERVSSLSLGMSATLSSLAQFRG